MNRKNTIISMLSCLLLPVVMTSMCSCQVMNNISDKQDSVVADNDMEVMQNIWNENRGGMVHFYGEKMLFSYGEVTFYPNTGVPKQGTYLSCDNGVTMTKLFDETEIFTYKDKIYTMKEDGVYVSNFDGIPWKKVNDVSPNTIAKRLYPNENYRAIEIRIINDRLFFRVADDLGIDFNGLYTMNLHEPTAEEIIQEGTLADWALTENCIYYVDADQKLYRIDLDGQNKELITENFMMLLKVVAGDVIYCSSKELTENQIYAYNVITKEMNPIKDLMGYAVNMVPKGLVVNFLSASETTSKVGLYSLDTGEVNILPALDKDIFGIYVAGSKIFAYDEQNNNFILLTQ